MLPDADDEDGAVVPDTLEPVLSVEELLALSAYVAVLVVVTGAVELEEMVEEVVRFESTAEVPLALMGNAGRGRRTI